MSKLKNLSLIASGIIIGIAISFSPEIHAATSKLLGGKVTKVVDVKKDGKTIGEGGIINGITYLPVRSVVNSVEGIEVGEVSSSEINLVSSDVPTSSIDNGEKAKQEEESMKQASKELSKKLNDLRSQIKDVTKKIDDAKFKINIEVTSPYRSAKMAVDNYENGKGGPTAESGYNIFKAELDKMNAEKVEAEKLLPTYEAQLKDLQQQLADLEAQLK